MVKAFIKDLVVKIDTYASKIATSSQSYKLSLNSKNASTVLLKCWLKYLLISRFNCTKSRGSCVDYSTHICAHREWHFNYLDIISTLKLLATVTYLEPLHVHLMMA
jgi:uncharacterized membrane protein